MEKEAQYSSKQRNMKNGNNIMKIESILNELTGSRFCKIVVCLDKLDFIFDCNTDKLNNEL